MENLSDHMEEIQQIYHLMRRQALSKQEFTERLTMLDRKPAGVDASCFLVWLLLRTIQPSQEKNRHLEQLAHRLDALSK